MKQVSAEYKRQIKELGREIDSIITYYNHYQVITEDNHYILTEDGQKILTEQIKQNSSMNITAEDIYTCKVITHGNLLKTMMKEFDFEVKQDIKIGSIVSYKFGVKVNGSYEYVDYGMFIVNKKEFNEDTQTYSYVAYDKMLFTMVPYKQQDLSRIVLYTLYDLAQYCCEYCRLQLGVESFPNSEREITSDALKLLEDGNYTFRDVLDYITEVTGCSTYLVDDNVVIAPPSIAKEVLPNEYTQVEYIQTSGTQYINTGLFPDSNLKIETKIEVASTNQDISVFGSTTTTTGNSIGSYYHLTPYNNKWYYGANNSEGNGGSYSPTIGTQYEIIFNDEDGGIKIDGTSIASNRTFVGIANSTLTIARRGSSNNGRFGRFKYFYFKIYDKDTNTLVRDYIPCYRNIDGEVGLYDLVNDEFYSNTGTGEFTYGEEVNDILTLREDSFKDTNVKFTETYGPINSVLFSRNEDLDVIEAKDDASIEANGVTQIKIKDNPFLEGDDRADYLEEIFDVLNGLTYTFNDLSTIGVTYLDYFDKFNVEIGSNTYPCLLLNDEINVEQGLEETIFTEQASESVDEYITSDVSVDDVSFVVDKANKQIVLKVDSDGKLALAELKQDADTGTEFNVKADNIKLEGYTTINNGFSIDLNGNMTCNNANIMGGSINMSSTVRNPAFTLQSSEYPALHTEVTGGSLGIYERTYQDEQVTVYTPRCAMSYSKLGNYSTFALDGLQSYANIGTRYVDNNPVSSLSLYDNNGGMIEVANLAGKYTITLQGESTNSGGQIRVRNSSLTNTILLKGSDSNYQGGYFEIKNSSGTGTIYGYGHNGSLVCTTLTQTSLAEKKKNFEKLENALDIVKDTDIYKYNLKDEKEDDKKHVGFVIGKNFNYREEITSKENDGVDTYSMISVLWQAVKEQQEQIEKLNQEIEQLKERIDK